MTKLNGLLAACALVLAAAPVLAQTTRPPVAQRIQQAPAQRVPLQVATTRPAPQPVSAVVAANGGWQRTQVTVQAGGQLTISATGRWASAPQSPNTIARANIPGTDANGYPNTAGQGQTILPSANIGALIGRIGDGAPFLVGASYNGTAPASGVLSLSMNDNSESFGDNSGRLAVNVTATAPPPRNPDTTTTTTPPATTSPPPATTTPTTTPTPTDGATPTPTDTTAPNDNAATDTTAATPADQGGGGTSDLAGAGSPFSQEDLIRYGLIGAAVLVGLFLLSRLFSRPSSSRSKRESVTVPRVTARVVDDGVSRQSLTIKGH